MSAEQTEDRTVTSLSNEATAGQSAQQDEWNRQEAVRQANGLRLSALEAAIRVSSHLGARSVVDSAKAFHTFLQGTEAAPTVN